MKRHKKLQPISYLFIIIGVSLALYPFFSYHYSLYKQAKLQREILQHRDFIEARDRSEAGTESDASPTEEVAMIKKNIKDNTALRKGFPGALLEIPALELSVAVVKGTSPEALKKGVGWYEESALPGKGNTAIAGHRNCYGWWFLKLDELKTGDAMTITFGDVKYTYEVEKSFVVSKYDWSVIEPCDYTALTLTTCHPIGSTENRLIVRASLKDTAEVSRTLEP